MSFRVRSLLLLLLPLACTILRAENSAVITRVFKIPSDFTSCETPPETESPAVVDPLAVGAPARASALPPRRVVKELLKSVGIDFPEGTNATFSPVTSLLTVTNTAPNLDLVEAYILSISHQSPATIACTLTVIEGPGDLIRQANAAASRTTNAAQEFTKLLSLVKNPGSNVRIVGDAFLETKSGTRATTEAVCDHTYASDFTMDANSRASVTHEMRQIGVLLEWEPTLGADGTTIESSISIKLHPSPPTSRQVSITEPASGGTAEFPATDISTAHFTTGITSTPGSTKFLGITKPVGTSKQNADILWAAFLTTNVRRMECLPFSQPAPQPQVAQVPAGMSAAAFNVPDDVFESFIEESQPPQDMVKQPMPLQTWFELNGITPVKGATAEHTNNVLTIINTPDNIERIASLTDECLRRSRKTAAFTLHTFQAPANFLRELTHQITASADDTTMLAAVEAAVARGEATFIDSLFLESKSGSLATHESVREHTYLSTFGTNAEGQPHLAFAMRPVGSILEIEPTFGSDGHTVEISLNHVLHSAPPEARREHFRDPSSNKPFDIPVIDFHAAKTTSRISMIKGGTKLISLNRPTGRGDADVLWATFLKCDLVTQVPKSRQAPAETKKKPPLDPKAWNTRMYHVPPDFLSTGGGSALTTVKERQEHLKSRHTAKMILEAMGVPFPEGATASFNPATSVLFVKNTNENLTLVDAYVEYLRRLAPKNVVLTAHVLQGPGPLLRHLTSQAVSKSDHRVELDEALAAVKAGTVQHLSTARIETKSGIRATSEQTIEYTAVTDVSMNDKGAPVFKQQMREVGLHIGFEPVVGADGILLEPSITLEFHTAPPLEHREHLIDTQGRRLEFPLTDYFTTKVTTGTTIPDGTTRLLSLYKPTGKPEFDKDDILHAIFITCDLLRAGE
ncbi:MAG: hypothetical protein K9N47_18780 [Prosthecobacter sp.]|uniref:hypothetical protein n=1 Tax=Prosthecobacter sp. TaxID=1965333 RepID=UPI0025ED0717|nr:hypothetical protein [Prosthecobacter sp.]MCF7788175.1 hypothetical protein [Prosthecobacter sp.]